MSIDYYKDRVEEVGQQIVTMYAHALGALEAVDPEALELLTRERSELLSSWRDLSAEQFFGRAQEPWLLALSDDIRDAEQRFEQRLRQEFDVQRDQMNTMQKNRKARRAYTSAA